jgi:hypothetical protein
VVEFKEQQGDEMKSRGHKTGWKVLMKELAAARGRRAIVFRINLGYRAGEHWLCIRARDGVASKAGSSRGFPAEIRVRQGEDRSARIYGELRMARARGKEKG